MPRWCYFCRDFYDGLLKCTAFTLTWRSKLRLTQYDTSVAQQGLKQSSLESSARILSVMWQSHYRKLDFIKELFYTRHYTGGLHIFPTEAQINLWGHCMSNVEMMKPKFRNALPESHILVSNGKIRMYIFWAVSLHFFVDKETVLIYHIKFILAKAGQCPTKTSGPNL